MQCKRFIRTTAYQLAGSKSAKAIPDAILALPPYTLPPASALRLTLYASDVNDFMKRVLDAKEPASAFDMEWSKCITLYPSLCMAHSLVKTCDADLSEELA